ncbi:MAG: Ig-like domain-containing protein [Candidatus Limnocylindria bacterium]
MAASLGALLSRHRAATRISLTALSLMVVMGLSQQAGTLAGPEQGPLVVETLLPRNVGIAIATNASITIPFDAAMEPASVESALQVRPGQRAQISWNEDHTALTLSPEGLWRTDESYLVVIPASSRTADGTTLRTARRFSFTTQTAPSVTDFQVRLATGDLPVSEVNGSGATAIVLDGAAEAAGIDTTQAASQPPTRTATRVSATSFISIGFSDQMDMADVEEHFAIGPQVDGDLSWSNGDLVFTPTERLAAGGRYTISLVGAHDRVGNVVGGKANFSFIVAAGAQLITTAPKLGATETEPASVEMRFSQPMDTQATGAAFSVTDSSTGAAVDGRLDWDEGGTQITFAPDVTLAARTTFEVAFGEGARDADGNPVSMAWSFTTGAAPESNPAAVATPPAQTAPVAPPAPVVPPPAPASSAAEYAVNQINASRAAYGFGPVVLDAAISVVAYAHAYDQALNGYFSHTGLDGSTRESRLRAGGISFGWSGENQCYLVGRTDVATLDWCHATFMAEPYPGQFNHIANVLNPNARRVGVGIAQVGSKIVVVWDFTD